MQSWEEYEADYYGGYPEGMRACPVDRWGNPMCRNGAGGQKQYPRTQRQHQQVQRYGLEYEQDYDRNDGHSGYYGRGWGAKDTALNYLAELESLYDQTTRDILMVIRNFCDTVDQKGCVVMEGELTAELMDMMVQRVLEQMDGPSEPAENGAEMKNALIQALMSQELLKRRMMRES